jgi:hypothetical protein
LLFAEEEDSEQNVFSQMGNSQMLKSKLPFLSDRSLDLIIAEFAEPGLNEINDAELIYSLKGQLEPVQENVIDRAFGSSWRM